MDVKELYAVWKQTKYGAKETVSFYHSLPVAKAKASYWRKQGYRSIKIVRYNMTPAAEWALDDDGGLQPIDSVAKGL
jgi:hypothetical protein